MIISLNGLKKNLKTGLSPYNLVLQNFNFDHCVLFEKKNFNFIFRTKAVLAKFPYYRVELRGVGAPPEKQEHVGYCSQLALFIRNSDYTPKIPEVCTQCLLSSKVLLNLLC